VRVDGDAPMLGGFIGPEVSDATMTMSVTVNVMIDGSTVLSVRGEIDHSTAGDLHDAIIAAVTERRPGTLKVDLGLVTFLDSAAVGALVGAQREASTEGTRLTIDKASPFVARQLRIAGVDRILGLPVDGDVPEPHLFRLL
jgi:anti-anti-sigma factor